MKIIQIIKKNIFAVALTVIFTGFGIYAIADGLKSEIEITKSTLTPMDFEITNHSSSSDQVITQQGISDLLCGTSNVTFCGASFDLDLDDPETLALLARINNEEEVTVKEFEDLGYTPVYSKKP